MPLTAVAGRVDRTAPFDGGNGLLGQRAWFERIARSVQGCHAMASPSALSDNVDSSVGDRCGACTELLVLGDGSHTWPGTSVGNEGLNPGEFDLNRRIVADMLAPDPGCLSSR